MQETMHNTRKPGASIVIPAYNEEGRIGSVLENYTKLPAFSSGNYEIIVVCNGCMDNTSEIVHDFAKRHKNVRQRNFEERLGKGGAIIEGFKIARGDFIGFVDADESTEVGEYVNLINSLIELKADGAIGSRRVKGSVISSRQPLRRRVSSRVFNLLVRAMFGLNFKDTQCGAKIFKKAVIEAVLDKLQTRGFEFDVELLWRMKKEGYTIKELPLKWKHSAEGTFNLKHAPGMFLSLVKLRARGNP